MGFRTFVAGETLLAADVNNLLMKQVVVVCTSGTRPASPVEGQTIYESDTDKLLTYSGSAWTLPKNVAGGVLGSASVTGAQTGITSETDLTGLTTTFTPPAGRRVRLEADVFLASTVAGDVALLAVKEGTTNLKYGQIRFGGTGQAETLHVSCLIAPTAAAHTYKLSLKRESGTGTLSNNPTGDNPSTLIAYDVGGV